MNTTKQLIRFANQRFPRTEYATDSAVRHNRRQWVRAVTYLRSGQQSKWVCDHRVPAK